MFDVKLVGLIEEMKLNEGLFTIETDAVWNEVHQTDLIIIPPMSGDMESGILLNKQYIPWITKHYKKASKIASLCIGAFLVQSVI